jgi:hypothetical protein
VFPVGIGLRDPRSQKRDLGHPSVSPSDIAEGTSFVISLRDDKEEGGGSVDSVGWTKPLFMRFGGSRPIFPVR